MTPVRRPPLHRWDLPTGSGPSLWQRLSPPQLFVSSFLLLVALGTVGFKALPGLYTGAPLGWLDALFTTTSAVCVTGLIVVDTATFFTPLGQAYILFLIQLGGLGVIALSSVIIVALGRRLSLRQEALAGSLESVPQADPRRLVYDVIRFTFVIEFIGAVILYALWVPRLGWRDAAWPAVFHSVSAFCNAGFSTFSDSLIGFQSAPFSLVSIALLIVVGGLGFLTLEEMYLRVKASRKRRIFRLSLHSRLVLVTTAVLTAGGWVLFALLEWENTLAGMSVVDKLTNALFLSVTPRTAGFNTIDYARATEASQFLTILLMTVGGSPGSTAGGLKTTTVALVALVAWSRLRGEETPSVWGRSVREELIDRSVGLIVVVVAVLIVGIFLISVFQPIGGEHNRFLDHAFEAASAINTVGLSTGLTPYLTPAGKFVGVTLMFLGRVGPLTFAAALALRGRQASFRYAYEDVTVG